MMNVLHNTERNEVYNNNNDVDFIKFPDDNGNMKTYIARAYNNNNFNKTSELLYKCNQDTDCLFNKCFDNFCRFNNESSVELCNNMYKYFSYFDYS